MSEEDRLCGVDGCEFVGESDEFKYVCSKLSRSEGWLKRWLSFGCYLDHVMLKREADEFKNIIDGIVNDIIDCQNSHDFSRLLHRVGDLRKYCDWIDRVVDYFSNEEVIMVDINKVLSENEKLKGEIESLKKDHDRKQMSLATVIRSIAIDGGNEDTVSVDLKKYARLVGSVDVLKEENESLRSSVKELEGKVMVLEGENLNSFIGRHEEIGGYTMDLEKKVKMLEDQIKDLESDCDDCTCDAREVECDCGVEDKESE